MKNLSYIKRSTFGFALLGVLSLIFNFGLIQAQTNQNAPRQVNGAIALTAVPPRLGDDYSLLVQPGETIQVVIEARNPQDEPVTVETFARDFIIGDDGATPVPVEPEDANPRWQLSKWLTLTPNNAVIEGRSISTILVTINVPTDAIPGGRYAMILHRPVNSSGGELKETSGAQINAQVGTLLYVIVDGELQEEAKVVNFKFAGLSEMGPVPYSLNIRNNSSYHIRPEARIMIKNWFGMKVGEFKLDSKNVFPDSERKYDGQWDKKWGFGRYKAEIVGAYGISANKNLNAVTAFWIIPYKLILAIILVLALVGAIIFSTRKKYSKMLEIEEEKVRKLDEKLKKARRN